MGVVPARSREAVTARHTTRKRKGRKNVLVRRRKERIRTCLETLSSLLEENEEAVTEDNTENSTTPMPQDNTETSRAILRLYSDQWQSLLTGEEALVSPAPASAASAGESSYMTGYKTCIETVDNLLKSFPEPGAENLRLDLLQHLWTRVQELTPTSTDS